MHADARTRPRNDFTFIFLHYLENKYARQLFTLNAKQ